MSPSAERSFIAIQRCLVPRSTALTAEQQSKSLEILRNFLANRPAPVRAKLGLFLRLVDALSLVYGRKRFFRLDQKKQKRLMQFLFDSKLPILRKGFWAINTLARMTVYGQSSIYPDLSYRLKPYDRTNA